MKNELAEKISKLTSNIYGPNGTWTIGTHEHDPNGLIEVGTVIPWLGNRVWAGNAESFANYCEEEGEPCLITNSFGTLVDHGKWLDDNNYTRLDLPQTGSCPVPTPGPDDWKVQVRPDGSYFYGPVEDIIYAATIKDDLGVRPFVPADHSIKLVNH